MHVALKGEYSSLKAEEDRWKVSAVFRNSSGFRGLTPVPDRGRGPGTVSDHQRRVIPLFGEHSLSVYLKCHVRRWRCLVTHGDVHQACVKSAAASQSRDNSQFPPKTLNADPDVLNCNEDEVPGFQCGKTSAPRTHSSSIRFEWFRTTAEQLVSFILQGLIVNPIQRLKYRFSHKK